MHTCWAQRVITRARTGVERYHRAAQFLTCGQSENLLECGRGQPRNYSGHGTNSNAAHWHVLQRDANAQWRQVTKTPWTAPRPTYHPKGKKKKVLRSRRGVTGPSSRHGPKSRLRAAGTAGGGTLVKPRLRSGALCPGPHGSVAESPDSWVTVV